MPVGHLYIFFVFGGFFFFLYFLYVCVCFVYLLWRDGYSDILSSFWLNCILVLSFVSCLYILEINPLSVTPFTNIFCNSVGCLLLLFMVSFVVQKVLSPICLSFIYFPCLRRQIQKNYCYNSCQSVLCMFSFRGFMVSWLTFRSLILMSSDVSMLCCPFYVLDCSPGWL